MIGIFDSTIGGLTVAKAIEQLLPERSLLYLGDIARAPYERKDAATVVRWAIENTQFLVENGAKIIVIGCSSAASAATETLRRTFDIPVFDIINPAVQEAVRVSRSKRIGVIGPHATINGNIFSSVLKSTRPEYRVFSKACPLLIPLLEERWINKKETKMILRKYLYSLKNQQPDTLILGSTYYSLLKELIQLRIGRKVTLIDPSIEVIKDVKRCIDNAPGLLPSEKNAPVKRHYTVSALTENTEYVAVQILKRPIQLHLT